MDKRQAILDAAFEVFARCGYGQACVKEVAEVAGVAKPTVYNHLHDKETLFRHAVTAAAEGIAERTISALDALRDPAGDLRETLGQVTRELAASCCDERAQALRRLTYGETAQFPDVLESVHARTALDLREVLADRLARLVVAGRLRPCEPGEAAGHLLALITGPLDARSRMGTRAVPPAEVERVAESAADVWWRAYGAPAGPAARWGS